MQVGLSHADDKIIHEPLGYWDWIIVPRVHFEELQIQGCLEFVEYKCNKEFKPAGEKDVIFEYHLSPKKVREPVTLDLHDVTLPDLLKKICLPHGIVIKEEPGKLIFSEKK